jgi:hypothetical protein
MNRSSRIALHCIILFSFTCSIIGCSDGLPRRVPVSGRVLLDGKPLERGTVQVFPKDQRMAYGDLGPGGKFTLTTFSENDGCIPGKHPVAVIAYQGIGSDKIQWFAPRKYIDPATSGLEIDVPGPRDDVEINLTWAGGKPFIEEVKARK